MQDQPITKYCRGCGETKPAREFSRDGANRDGLRRRCDVVCADCHVERHRIMRLDHPVLG